MKNKHKISTVFLMIFIGFTLSVAVMGGIDEELDQLCQTNDRFLYRYGGKWVCAQLPQPTITNVNNTYITINGTINGTNQAIPKFGENNSLTNSLLTENGTTIHLQGNLNVTGNISGGPWTKTTGTTYLTELTDNVGIGTTNPTGKLHIKGDDVTQSRVLRLEGSTVGVDYLDYYSNRPIFRITSTEGTDRSIHWQIRAGSTNQAKIVDPIDDGDLLTVDLVGKATRTGYFTNFNAFGFNTTTPDATLAVNGNGYIRENVYYDVTSWANSTGVQGGIAELSDCSDIDWFNISEKGGTSPGMNTTFYFDNVDSFRSVIFEHLYTGNHDIHISMYNFDLGEWIIKRDVSGTDTMSSNYWSMGGSANAFINSTGSVWINLLHPQTGNNAHMEEINCIKLER